MTTPAPHTPVNFLKGGGSAMFSAACVKLLADVGFKPEDFGSYDQVSKRVEQKRRRVNRVVRAREQRAEATGGEAAPLPPSLAQHQGQEVAHLGQNSCRQRQRGNPCTNLVDGHDDGLYPCVLVDGPAMVDGQPNPDSTHGRMTQQEQDDAVAGGRQREGALERDRHTGEVTSGPPNPRAGGAPPHESSRYPADDMARDERARIDSMVGERQGSSQPTGQAQDGAAGAAGPSDRAQKAVADHEAALAKSPAERAAMPPSEIDGTTAAECIESFKKMAEASMRQKCKDDVEKNAATAGTTEQREALQRERARTSKRADRAQRKEAEARAAHRDARKRLREQSRRAGLESSNPKIQQKAQERLRQARDEAEAAAREAQRRSRMRRSAEREARTAAAAHSKARNAACLADQGRRLREGPGRTDGRAPPAGGGVGQSTGTTAPAATSAV